ncbi:MAG: hypothetical protein V4476_11475 [Pseudomonadota bacterium]
MNYSEILYLAQVELKRAIRELFERPFEAAAAAVVLSGFLAMSLHSLSGADLDKSSAITTRFLVWTFLMGVLSEGPNELEQDLHLGLLPKMAVARIPLMIQLFVRSIVGSTISLVWCIGITLIVFSTFHVLPSFAQINWPELVISVLQAIAIGMMLCALVLIYGRARSVVTLVTYAVMPYWVLKAGHGNFINGLPLINAASCDQTCAGMGSIIAWTIGWLIAGFLAWTISYRIAIRRNRIFT